MATGKHETHDLKAASLFDVSHITAIVTGGGTGIGLMITQALVANGAKVYITGRRAEVLESTIKQYEGGGSGSMHALPGDISSQDEVLRIAKEMEGKEPNGIHLLVNNAGIALDDATKFSSNGQPDMKDPNAISQHFLRTSESAWLDTYRTNVTAGYNMAMAFLPQLAKGANHLNDQNDKNSSAPSPPYSSQVINVSSVSGCLKGSSGGQFAYAASKAAFTHVSRMLATTFKDVRVRVNIIAPGVFPSEMTTGSSGDDNKSTLSSEASNPSGRYGWDSDMAGTVLFLAGKSGAWYNEQILYPDGGSTMAMPAAK